MISSGNVVESVVPTISLNKETGLVTAVSGDKSSTYQLPTFSNIDHVASAFSYITLGTSKYATSNTVTRICPICKNITGTGQPYIDITDLENGRPNYVCIMESKTNFNNTDCVSALYFKYSSSSSVSIVVSTYKGSTYSINGAKSNLMSYSNNTLRIYTYRTDLSTATKSHLFVSGVEFIVFMAN